MEDINKLKVTELRNELQVRGLDTKGLKNVLVDRLRKAMEDESGVDQTGSDLEEQEEEEEIEDLEGQPDETFETVADITPQKARSPRKVGSPQKVDNFPSVTSPKAESPEKIVSPQTTPQKMESPLKTPQKMESPQQTPQKMESPQKTPQKVESPQKTPQKVESPQKTPEKIESPQKTPQKAESPEKMESPQKTPHKLESPQKTPLKVESPHKMESPPKEVQSDEKEGTPQKEEVAEDESMEVTESKDTNSDTVPESNGVMEDSTNADECKKEADVEMDLKEKSLVEEADDHRSRRGEKRSRSPNGERGKRHRPDIEEVRQENEPEFDKSLVVLDWYSSDLSLLIEPNRLEASPMHRDGFGYLWHSAKSTYGVNKGRVCFEIKILDNLDVSHIEGEEHPHVVRVGWSFDLAGLILGEEKHSWGFGGTGKASVQSNFKSYGKAFGKGDVLGCFLDLESDPAIISYAINGENFGTCFELPREDIQDAGIFPHIMTKNCSFKVNFGDEEPAFELLEGYEFIGKIPIDDRMLAVQGPEKKEDAQVIMMVGLPASGKTTWAEKYLREHPEKKFNILGTNNLIDRMKVLGLPRRRNYAGRWDFLIEKCTKALNKLLFIAYKRRRNYIIDQTNVYPSAQRRKMHGFQGFQRRAVVICPTDDDLKKRSEKRDSEEGKDVPERAVLEMKGNYQFPEVGETFESIEFIELSKDEGELLLQKYNKEGELAGFGPRRNNRGGQRRGGFGGGGGGGGDRRGYNRGGGGYRGNWDRERDRKGNFDRRDRGNWQQRDNRDYRSGGGGGGSYNRDNRSGGSGGGGGGYNKDRNSNYNRDRQNRSGGGGWQSGSGYRNQNQGGGSSGGSGSGYDQGGWNSQQQQWGNQGWGSGGSGGSGQNYSSGYNWNQQQYGQQTGTQPQQSYQQQHQQQQQTTQQSQAPQQYWTNQQGYGSQQTGYNAAAVGYGTQSYGTSGYNQNYSQQQVATPQTQQQWGGYGTNYSQSYSTQNQSQGTGYNRK